MKKIKTKSGSVALISVLIISAMLLIMVVGMAEAQVSVLYQYQDNMLGKSTFYFAESCLEDTMRSFERNTALTRTAITEGDDKSCEGIISGTGDTRLVEITTVEGDYTQHFIGSFSYSLNGTAVNTSLISWEKT